MKCDLVHLFDAFMICKKHFANKLIKYLDILFWLLAEHEIPDTTMTARDVY